MAERAQVVQDKLAARAMAIVQELLREYHPRDFAVELWDGSRLDPDPGQFCRFTWHINHASTLRALLRSDKQVAFGEAYIYDDYDIPSDILSIFLDERHLVQN